MTEFYTLDRILKEDADYNLIIGERSNGKTYAVQEYCIKHYMKTKGQLMYLRRWMEDVTQSNAINFFDINLLAKLPELTDGQFTNIVYRTGRYFLCNFDDKGKPDLDEDNVIGFVRDVNESERIKGLGGLTHIDNIFYDEFISSTVSGGGYIQDEVTYFVNIVATIARKRTNVKVWMCGNTINPYNPFFTYWGIDGLKLRQGDILTKTSSRTGLKVAVEWCKNRRKGSLYGTSAKYFDNFDKDTSSLYNMGVKGQWQLPDYPTMRYPNDSKIIYMFTILFNGEILEVQTRRKTGIKDKQRYIDYYIYVNHVKHISSMKRMYILDLDAHIETKYKQSILLLPDCDGKSTFIDCINNGKIFFKDRLTGAFFNNFYIQSMRNKTIH